MDARTLMAKGDYAKTRGISGARVSQYITEGLLDGALFHTDGTPAGRGDRFAKIHKDLADQALRRKLNIGQVVGQGRLPPSAADPDLLPLDHRAPYEGDTSPAPAAARPPSEDDAAATELLKLRLDKARRDDERDRRKHAEEIGTYTPTALMRVEVTRAYGDLVASVETWLPDLSGAIAAVLAEGKPLDKRAVQLLLGAEWRKFRAIRAKAARERRDNLPPLIADPDDQGAEEEEPAATE